MKHDWKQYEVVCLHKIIDIYLLSLVALRPVIVLLSPSSLQMQVPHVLRTRKDEMGVSF